MRRIHAVIIICWIGTALACSTTSVEALVIQPENLGPTIVWQGPENSSMTAAIAWDGAYTGQTEESWCMDAWINDTDGVYAVIFMFKEITGSEWSNITPSLVEGNDTLGRYQYNYTYAVWWNYTLNRPQVEGTGGNFNIKIFANDSLGHWTETGVLTYMGGYMIVHPPPDIAFIMNVLPSLVGIAVFAVALVVIVMLRRRH